MTCLLTQKTNKRDFCFNTYQTRHSFFCVGLALANLVDFANFVDFVPFAGIIIENDDVGPLFALYYVFLLCFILCFIFALYYVFLLCFILCFIGYLLYIMFFFYVLYYVLYLLYRPMFSFYILDSNRRLYGRMTRCSF